MPAQSLATPAELLQLALHVKAMLPPLPPSPQLELLLPLQPRAVLAVLPALQLLQQQAAATAPPSASASKAAGTRNIETSKFTLVAELLPLLLVGAVLGVLVV